MSGSRLLSGPDCPLLADDPAGSSLIEQFNALAQQFQQAPPGLLEREEGRKLVTRLDRVRDRLTRRHYRVGFLGTSSAGKSTIFNLVLQEKIAESGSGDATTSLPSRLRRREGDRECQLFYLTEEQYRNRLKKLCVEVGIGSPPDAEEALLAIVAQLKPTLGGAEEPGQRTVRADDIRYLKAFLASRRAYRHRLKPGPAAPVSVPFHNRSAFINHSDSRGADEADEGLLLAEAHLFIPNPRLPDRLELCDLPGLNAKRSVDSIVTGDFLDELDGALVFVNVAENLANAVVKGILDRLAYRYGDDLCGRAWVVFNKCDTLTESHYFPENGRRSVFDNIGELLRDAKIPVSQVCFTARKLVDESSRREGPLPREDAARYLGLSGDDAIPKTCPADLRPVWEQLVTDGGVGRLRHLILNEIAHTVAQQITQAARTELTRVAEDLRHLVEIEARRKTGGPALRQKAMACRNTVLWLRQGLASRARDFPVLAELRDHLRATLAQTLCPDERHVATLKSMSPAKLEQQFGIDARNLDDILLETLAEQVIDRVYEQIGQHLTPLPPIPVGKHEALSEAWEEFRRADRSDPSWMAIDGPHFASEEVLAGLGGRGSYQQFDGEIYLDLMGEKVRVAISQVVHQLRTRLRGRLGELERELDRLLATETPTAPRTSP